MAASTKYSIDEFRQIKADGFDPAILNAANPLPDEARKVIRNIASVLPTTYEEKAIELLDAYIIAAETRTVAQAKRDELAGLMDAGLREVDKIIDQLEKDADTFDPNDLSATVDQALIIREFFKSVIDADQDKQKSILKRYEALSASSLNPVSKDDVRNEVLETLRESQSRSERDQQYGFSGHNSEITKPLENRAAFLFGNKTFGDNLVAPKYVSLQTFIEFMRQLRSEFRLNDHCMYILLKKYSALTSHDLVNQHHLEGSSVNAVLKSLSDVYGDVISSDQAFAKLMSLVRCPLYRSLSRNLSHLGYLAKLACNKKLLTASDTKTSGQINLILSLTWGHNFLNSIFPHDAVRELFSQYNATCTDETSQGVVGWSRFIAMSVFKLGEVVPEGIVVEEDVSNNTKKQLSGIDEAPPTGFPAQMVPLGNPKLSANEIEPFSMPPPSIPSGRQWQDLGSNCHLCNTEGHYWRGCPYYGNERPGHRECRECGGFHRSNCKAKRQN
jgi:hypothetical protein